MTSNPHTLRQALFNLELSAAFSEGDRFPAWKLAASWYAIIVGISFSAITHSRLHYTTLAKQVQTNAELK